jgi:hypothetical protein
MRMRISLALLLAAVAMPTFGEPDVARGGTSEWSLNLLLIGSKHYAFEGGATARNDGGAGIGLSLARNLNDYFAVGVDASVGEFDYRARIAPGTGNAGPGFDSSGTMETAAVRFHATYYLLARRLTPFLTAGAGASFLDTNLESDPPANACWVYPWYGQVCSDKAPKTTLARLSYGAGAGLRLDLPGRQGFLRALVSGEWIEFAEARSTVGSVQLRADFGLRF